MSKQLIARFNIDYNPIHDVSHELCKNCNKHNVSCMPTDMVCHAIEILVQLCKVKSEEKQIEYLGNISDLLDLENSFNGMPDEQ